MSLLTFILLVVVGAMWNHHGDASGTSTGGLSDYLNTTGQSGPDVPVSQVGINQLANEAGHLRRLDQLHVAAASPASWCCSCRSGSRSW